LLFETTYLTAFLPLLGLGLFYLFLVRNIQSYQIAGAFLLLLLLGSLTGILALSSWRPQQARRLLGWLQFLVERIGAWTKHTPILGSGWADRNVAELGAAAVAVAAHPRRLGRALFTALVAHLVNLTCLYALFLGYQQPVGFGPLLAGYAMGILFWIVSVTPQGVGVVEGVMTLVFASLGIPASGAAVIALAFRGLTFWLPLAVGFFLFRRGGRKPGTKHFTAGLRAGRDT